MLQRRKIVQWPVWARTSDSRWNLLDCSKQVNFAKIFCGAKRSRRCMNTRSAFKYTYLLTWLLWLNNQLHPMQIITLCSIGFLRILFGGNSAVEMFLHVTSFNKRIIRILFTEWSQSDKMLFITESTKNNSLAYLDNFLFPLNHSVGLQGILIIQLDQIFTYLSYCSIGYGFVVKLNPFSLTNPDNAKTLNQYGVTKLLPHWLYLCFLYF